MESKKILIGSHVSMNAPNYYLGSVEEALSYHASAFMFYTGAPQNSIRKPLNELRINEGLSLIKKSNLSTNGIICHAPYIINAANGLKKETRDISIEFLKREIIRAEGFNAKVLVVHPGAHLSLGTNEGIKNLVNALDEILSSDSSSIKIALETMAGKGTEIGKNFEEISQILKMSKYSFRLGVCLDTCHLFDSGYDLDDIDQLLKEFDNVIGLNKLLVIHLNDSKNVKGSHKDRHENIGYGNIGFNTLCKYVHHPLLIDVPKILETPYVNGLAPYKIEIKMLLEEKFIPSWRELLLK